MMKHIDLVLPNRKKPTYKEACLSIYAYPMLFISLKIRIYKTNSKNYKKAAFICSLLPNYKKEHELISFIITSEKDYFIYYDAVYKLFKIIHQWKYVEFYINEQICYPDEFWLFINHSKPAVLKDSRKLDIATELKVFNSRWNEEKHLYHIVKNLFPIEKVYFHYHAKWLGRLELDIYIEEYKIAIEYQGIQHYEAIQHWDSTKGLENRKINDMKKKRLCEENGVTLIYFDYTESITDTLVIAKIYDFLLYKEDI